MPDHAGPLGHLVQAAFPDPARGTEPHLSLRKPSALCICLFLSELNLNVQPGYSLIFPIRILHFQVCVTGLLSSTVRRSDTQYYFQTLYCYYLVVVTRYSKESLGAQSASNSSHLVLPSGAQQEQPRGPGRRPCAWEPCCGFPSSQHPEGTQGLPLCGWRIRG